MSNVNAGNDPRAPLRIGSRVACQDGEAGRLERVVFSPRRGTVTHLVIHRGLLGHRDRVVPIRHVVRITDETIVLDLLRAALAQFPLYDPAAFTTPAADWQAAHGYGSEQAIMTLGGASADLHGRPAERSGVLEPRTPTDTDIAVVSEGMQVLCRDGMVGRVALVLLHQHTHHATHIVVRRRTLRKRDIIVPLDWVTAITPQGIILDAEMWQVDQLPDYRPDDVIEEDVRQALYDDPAFQEGADLYAMRVSVRTGVVELRGNVRNSTRKREAELIARRVGGVLDVRNLLVADDELAWTVERALKQDDRLEIEVLSVEAILGLVHLRGRVGTPEQRAGAAEVARHVPGVQAINNALDVQA